MAEQELNVEAAVDSIASDIGLGNNEEAAEHEDTTSEDVAADTGQDGADDAAANQHSDDPAQQQKQDDGGQAQTQVRQPPKAWAKEQHEHWAKLDPKVQEYIEHREKQMLEGLTQYSESAKFGNAVRDVMKPHIALIRQQNIEPAKAIDYLFNAHRQLSTGSEEQKTAFLAEVAKTYGLDLGKAAALAGQRTEEPAYVRELRERQERLERERQAELSERQSAESKRIEKQVTDFAEAKDANGNPKHPYFDECAEDIVALVNAGHTLESAYEKAVYANPVTRAKEIARLRTEEEAAMRAKAKKEAEAARNASRTNVNSRDTRREPTAPKGKRWEDTLDQTMQEIKQRESTH